MTTNISRRQVRSATAGAVTAATAGAPAAHAETVAGTVPAGAPLIDTATCCISRTPARRPT